MLNNTQQDNRTKYFIDSVNIINKVIPIPETSRALELLLHTMNKENGFYRKDGSDYFTHCIEIAQKVLDFGIVKRFIELREFDKADSVLAVALLHDFVEDVDNLENTIYNQNFSALTKMNILNVTKKEGEKIEDYHKRVGSDEISAIVKVLDRLHNITTLYNCDTNFRKRQVDETLAYYIPLIKEFRQKFVTNKELFWQVKLIIEAVIREIQREFEHLKPADPITKNNCL